MERETINLKTPLKGVEIVAKSYITGGELIEIEAATASAGVKSVDGKTGEVNMRAEDAYRRRLRKLVDVAIVSISGETEREKVWSAVISLVARDYTWLMAKINQICEGLTIEDEKK